MTAVSEIIMGKKRNYAPLWKKTQICQKKYPETQTRPKKPRSSGKNPAVVTLVLQCALAKYRVVPKKNCTKFNAPSFCNRFQWKHAVFIKMPRKDHCLQSMQNLHKLVKYSLIWQLKIDCWQRLRKLKKMLDCRQNDYWVSSETSEMAYAVWSLTNNWAYWLRWKAEW